MKVSELCVDDTGAPQFTNSFWEIYVQDTDGNGIPGTSKAEQQQIRKSLEENGINLDKDCQLDPLAKLIVCITGPCPKK